MADSWRCLFTDLVSRGNGYHGLFVKSESNKEREQGCFPVAWTPAAHWGETVKLQKEVEA